MDEARAFLQRKKDAEGWTTSEMARQLGVNRVYLHLILTGRRPVTVSLAKRLRHAYPELLLLLVREMTAPVSEAV